MAKASCVWGVRAVVAAVCSLGIGCFSGGGDDMSNGGLTVTPSSPFVTVGADRVLGIEFADINLVYEDSATWTTSDPTIATVTDRGVAHGVGAGVATLTVHYRGKSGGQSGGTKLRVVEPLPVARGAVISLFNNVTCALASDGRAICWGQNSFGVCGRPPYDTPQAIPTPVIDDHAYTSIAVGGIFACGTTASGVTYCWGTNDTGVLGFGPNPPPSSATPGIWGPNAVLTSQRFVSVVAGLNSACALNAAGELYCWGLGTTTPTRVLEEFVFASIEARGNRTCGVTPQRTVACYGPSEIGLLAAGDADVWMAHTVGETHNCLLGETGAAYCWGLPSRGQLGSSTGIESCRACELCSSYDCVRSPQPVDGGVTFTSLSAGAFYTCGLSDAGAAYCWGANSDSGAVGDGTATDWAEPRPVNGGYTFASVVAGGATTCGVTAAGALYCWGNNSWGQVGDGNVLTTQTSEVRAVIGVPSTRGHSTPRPSVTKT